MWKSWQNERGWTTDDFQSPTGSCHIKICLKSPERHSKHLISPPASAFVLSWAISNLTERWLMPKYRSIPPLFIIPVAPISLTQKQSQHLHTDLPSPVQSNCGPELLPQCLSVFFFSFSWLQSPVPWVSGAQSQARLLYLQIFLQTSAGFPSHSQCPSFFLHHLLREAYSNAHFSPGAGEMA